MTYLDIETVSGFPSFFHADERTKELFTTKMRLKIEQGADVAELYKKEACLYAEFNKIVCASFGAIDGGGELKIKSCYGDNEREILEGCSKIIDKSYSLCAYYGKGFDFKVLSQKFIIHNIKLPYVLDNAGKKPWEINLEDPAEMWKFGDFKHTASLDLLAHCFGIPSPKQDVCGADVGRLYWEDKELMKIVIYCEGDVRTLAEVHKRIKQVNAVNIDDSQN